MLKLIFLILSFILAGCSASTAGRPTPKEISQDDDFYYLTLKIPKKQSASIQQIMKSKDSGFNIIVREVPSIFVVNSSSIGINFEIIKLNRGMTLDLQNSDYRNTITSNAFHDYLIQHNLSIVPYGNDKLIWEIK